MTPTQVTRPGSGRLYFTDLDTVAQVAAVDGVPHRWGESTVPVQLRGVVRVAVLMGGRLVLTDNQLLDGRVFAALGPAGFGRLVAAHPADGAWPLEVHARRADLAASLRALLVLTDEPAAPLAGYRFSVLDDESAGRVAAALSLLTVAELDAAIAEVGVSGGVAAILEKCGADAAQCRALARVWQAWIDAQPWFTVMERTVRPPFTEHPGAGHVESAAAVLQRAGVPMEGRETLERLADPAYGIDNRSLAYRELDALADQGRAFARAADVLRQWVDARYQRAQAESIGADLLESRVGRDRDRDVQVWDDRHVLTLDDELARDVGEMPPEVFATLRFQTRGHMRAWWAADRRARRRAQRQLAFAVAQQTETADVTRLVRSAGGKVVVLVAALGVVEIHAEGWWRALVVAVAACFTAAPELYEARELRGGRLDRMVNLARQS